MNHWQALQQTYGTCYKQIRWPHTSNLLDIIFHWISAAYFWLQNFNIKLIKEINVLQIFVKEQCFEKKCFDIKTWKEFSSVMDRPMFLNMSKTFCNLETRNMKFNRCFFKCFHWVMLPFWHIDRCKDWKKSAQCYTKCVWFSKSLSQIYPCCNKFQVNLFLFQRFDIMFILPSDQPVV